MRRFVIKFCILFAIIDGFLLWYALAIRPNISGDMGELAKFPFGKAYNRNIIHGTIFEERYVHDVQDIDSIPQGGIITIGDSFSQQDSLGYQQYLGNILKHHIFNINVEDTRINHPEKSFVRLVNNGFIDSTQIVIVESVERSIIGRLNKLDFDDTTMVKLKEARTNGGAHIDYAEEAMQKLRLMFGYRRPIVRYSLSQPMFSHPKYHSNIFIYHSPYIGDSDLLFPDDSICIIEAYEKLEKLHQFAEAHKIKMIYLIVPDKYDVYYPSIVR